MNPITHYNILFPRLEKEHREGRAQDRWYIFLLMNRNKITPAGSYLINNYSYMDDRTQNVTFHIPGYFKDFMTYFINNFACDVVDAGGVRLYFDRDGFQRTIDWLEGGGGGYYRYSENLDLVVVRYRHEKAGRAVEDGFCLSDLVAYNLDRLENSGVNTLGFINHIKDVVRYAKNEHELQGALEDYIFRTAHGDLGYCSSRCSSYDKSEPVRPVQTSQILVVGCSRVQAECDTVVSVFNNLPPCDEIRYSCKSVSLEDLRSGGGFVCADFQAADKVIFILDGHENDMTVQEFQDAVGSIIGCKPVHVCGKKKVKKKSIFSFMDNTYTPGKLAYLLREGKMQLNGRYVEFENDFELKALVSSGLKFF